jgi:hypothetical protein
MSLEIFTDLEQGTDEWLAARCGIVTASVVGQLITKGSPDALDVHCPKCQALPAEACISAARKVPTPIKTAHDERVAKASALPPVYGVADNDTSRALTLTLVSERITGYVEPIHPSRDMERGSLSEPFARDIYSENYQTATEVGFMVRDDWGFRLGYSPDGLVGDEGLLEIKSPRQKKHLATILADEVPLEHMAQIQAGLLVSGREWLDFVSYCGGMPLYVTRVLPDEKWQKAIIDAVTVFEESAAQMIEAYQAAVDGRPATERIDLFGEIEITF